MSAGKAHRTAEGWLVALDAPDVLLQSDLPLGWAVEVYRTRLGYWKAECWYIGHGDGPQRVMSGRFLRRSTAGWTAHQWVLAEERDWPKYVGLDDEWAVTA